MECMDSDLMVSDNVNSRADIAGLAKDVNTAYIFINWDTIRDSQYVAISLRHMQIPATICKCLQERFLSVLIGGCAFKDYVYCTFSSTNIKAISDAPCIALKCTNHVWDHANLLPLAVVKSYSIDEDWSIQTCGHGSNCCTRAYNDCVPVLQSQCL